LNTCAELETKHMRSRVRSHVAGRLAAGRNASRGTTCCVCRSKPPYWAACSTARHPAPKHLLENSATAPAAIPTTVIARQCRLTHLAESILTPGAMVRSSPGARTSAPALRRSAATSARHTRSTATRGRSARCPSAGVSTRATTTRLASAGCDVSRTCRRTQAFVSAASTRRSGFIGTGACAQAASTRNRGIVLRLTCRILPERSGARRTTRRPSSVPVASGATCG